MKYLLENEINPIEFCLKEGESEILFPGLKDMPKEIPEDAELHPPQWGENNLNWKGGISLDKKAWTKTYYRKPEVKAKKKSYRDRPENKAKKKEYNKEYKEIPENKAKTKEYNKEYNQRPEVKERYRKRGQTPERKAYMKLYYENHR